MTHPRPPAIVAGLVAALAGACTSAPADAGPVVGGAEGPTASTQSTPAAAPEVSGTVASPGPRTRFVLEPDGSSGRTAGGEGIPNLDAVTRTVATYYGDTGSGASTTGSPYAAEVQAILRRQTADLQSRYDAAVRRHQKPAIVLDTDDTTLLTYDLTARELHFTSDAARAQEWVDAELFPATPGMVDYVNRAHAIGYTVVGITGRPARQKAKTLANLAKVGYTGFTAANFYTRWSGAKPSYLRCRDARRCTRVEYKAGTRRHLERSKGLTVVTSLGDQWSDLQGGYADHVVKLPNPMYLLSSPNLPGVEQPRLAPRTRFTLAADGSSGASAGGEGIPNVDVVEKTIAVYYGDKGTGRADRRRSPYARELAALVGRERRALAPRYRAAVARGQRPALVLDADDTTLLTYDQRSSAVHGVVDPAVRDRWVEDRRFPAVPAMVAYVRAAQEVGFTVFGTASREEGQRAATLANLAAVGYPADAFVAERYFTVPRRGSSLPPGVPGCADGPTCTRAQHAAAVRAHLEDDLGYTVVATFSDQYAELQGGHAGHPVKLLSPTSSRS